MVILSTTTFPVPCQTFSFCSLNLPHTLHHLFITTPYKPLFSSLQLKSNQLSLFFFLCCALITLLLSCFMRTALFFLCLNIATKLFCLNSTFFSFAFYNRWLSLMWMTIFLTFSLFLYHQHCIMPFCPLIEYQISILKITRIPETSLHERLVCNIGLFLTSFLYGICTCRNRISQKKTI